MACKEAWRICNYILDINISGKGQVEMKSLSCAVNQLGSAADAACVMDTTQ